MSHFHLISNHLRNIFLTVFIVTFTMLQLSCSVGGDSKVDSALGGGNSGIVGDSAFTAAPSSYDFGNVSINATAAKTFIITNSTTLPIAVSNISLNSLQYSMTATDCLYSPSLVQPGQSCAVSVSFNPTTPGLIGAALKINYGLNPESSTSFNSSFGLSGTGVSPLVFTGLQSISSMTHTSMQLNWNSTPQATSFLVFKVVGANLVFEKIVVNASGTLANNIVTGLQPFTSYTWRVRGVDVFGNAENNSHDVTASTLANINPSLSAIGAQTSYQGLLWSVNANNTVTNNDTDADGDILTYSCYYDMVVNGSVNSTSSCDSLLNANGTAASFNTATGVLNWTPPYTVGVGTQFEFRITATDPFAGTDSKIFVNTVNAGLPILAHTPAGSFTFPANCISSASPLLVDFYNSRTSADLGVDSYSCTFDQVIDGAVAAGTNCSSLPGTVAFDTSTGILNWTPSNLAWGAYEIKVVGTNPAGANAELIIVDVASSYQSASLLSYWDAGFADLAKPAVNSPLTTTWKNLSSAGNAWDGTLSFFAGTNLSGWTSSGNTKIAFDGVNDQIDFGSSINSENTVGLDFWLNPGDQNKSTIFSFGDGSGNGLSLKQSSEGDGRLVLTTSENTYTEEVLADSPVEYYRLNEPAGAMAFDISRSKSHGTYGGVVVKGASGALADGDTSVTINGSSLNAPAPVSSTVTIEVWAATTSLASSPMLWRTGPNGAGPDLFFSTNTISLNVWDGGNNPFCTSPVAVTDGNFHHYVTVLNGSNSTAQLYFDGVLCGSAAYRNPTATSTTISSGLGSYEWNGSIDEVAIYTTALSAGRVAAHYNAKSRATCRSKFPVMTAAWDHVFAGFNDGTKTLSLFVNGENQCSITQTNSISGSVNSLKVGTNAAATSPWKGSVAAARTYASSSSAIATTNFSADTNHYTTHLPLASMRLWLQADSFKNIIDNSAIPFWLDQSRQGNHAVQETVGNQPKFRTNIINGKPAIQYDGSNSCLITANSDAVTDYSIFIVFKDDGVASSYERLIDKDYVSGFYIGRDSNLPNSFRSGYQETSAPYGIANTFSDAQPHILSTTKSGAVRKLFSDGAGMVSDTVTSTGTSSSKYGIGCYQDGSGSQKLGGYIAEVIIYNTALSDTDRQRVERYLGAKYNITVP